LACDYGYLAEVALAQYQSDPQPRYLTEAQSLAQQALEISGQAVAQSASEGATAPIAEKIFAGKPTQSPAQIALRYQWGRYLYWLAIAQQLQNQPTAALINLEKARQYTDARYDLTLYRQILEKLWHLYFEHQQYAQAFDTKLAQRRLESLFGLRAFIGASQIPPAALSPSENSSFVQPLATEIKASGREQDIDVLINRLSQPRYPIVVIHGPSGVGKSSILSAGLMPRLRQLMSEGRTTHSVFINQYSRWASQIANALSDGDIAERRTRHSNFDGIALDTDLSQNNSANSASASEPSFRNLLNQLRTYTQEKYQQIVLIFDQFEDFFYEYPAIEERRDLYAFLRECLDLPYVKVVMSLREDYLHYLLEWDRNADLSAIENDILSKEIRYYLGNFTPKSAEKVIRQLTQTAGFYLEEALITALVDDLAAQMGEIRPIELQMVGAQLQREKITTLEQYRQLGRSPKHQLLKNLLDSVIHDCGPENKTLAQLVLYLLSEGTNRPIKSHSEIKEALASANMAYEPSQLQLVLHIFIGSGLIFEVPEISGVRYQLVHEYFASLVQQPTGMMESDLLEALKTERSRRQQSDDQLQAALAAQSDSQTQTTLARQRTEVAEIKALVSMARSLKLSGNGLGALAKALQAAQQLRNSIWGADGFSQLGSHRYNSDDAAASSTGNSAGNSTGNSTDDIDHNAASNVANRSHEQNHEDSLLSVQTALCLEDCLQAVREKNELFGHQKWVLAIDCYPLKTLPFSLLSSSPQDESQDSPQEANGNSAQGLSSSNNFSVSHPIPHIISASDDGMLKLWSQQGELLRTLDSHKAGVVDVCFSPDGHYFASASLDHTICLWHADGAFIRCLETPAARVTSLSFSPTEPMIAVSYGDAPVSLWHLSGELVRALPAQANRVSTVAFSPDGKLLATGGEDQTVKLWTVSGRLLHTLRGQQGWVRSVAFSPDGRTLVSAGDANILRLWSVDGRKLKTLYGHDDWVRCVAFSPDGQRIASASDDQTIKIWGAEGTIQQTFRQRSSVHTVAWSADGQSVVSGGDDNLVHVWHLNGPPEPIGKGHVGIVWSAQWQPLPKRQTDELPANFSQKLLSAGSDNAMRLWRDDANLLSSISGHRRGVHSVSWRPGGDFFASASADHSVRIWTAAGEAVRSLTGHDSSVWKVCYSPNGEQLASVGCDRTLRIWSHEGDLLHTWTGHTDTVWHVSYSPDSHHLITASEDNTLRLWHAKKGLVQTLKVHAGGVWCGAFSPNGDFLASGGADGVIFLWAVNRQGPEQLRIAPNPLMLKGHRDWVRGLRFSPNGELLASVSDDGTLRLWSVSPDNLTTLKSASLNSAESAGQLLPPLQGHEGVIWDVDFDASGQRLVTAGADGTVRIWDLRLNNLADKGCQWLADWLIARPEAKAQLCPPA
jgi:WD40 repeat protein